MNEKLVGEILIWFCNLGALATLAWLAASGAWRESVLRNGPGRVLGFEPMIYATGVWLVSMYVAGMWLLGGPGSPAWASAVLALFPFAIVGLFFSRVMSREGAAAAVGLVPCRPGREIGWGVLAGGVALVFAGCAGHWLYVLLQRLGEAPPMVVHQTLRTLREDFSYAFLLQVIVFAVVLAPLLEEMVFRGVLQTSLLRLMGGRRWAAIGAASLVFGLVHWWVVPWHGLIPLVLVGVVWGYAYERTGSLLVAVVGHAVFNALNVAVAVLTLGPT